jgi:hypothetical protein
VKPSSIGRWLTGTIICADAMIAGGTARATKTNSATCSEGGAGGSPASAYFNKFTTYMIVSY